MLTNHWSFPVTNDWDTQATNTWGPPGNLPVSWWATLPLLHRINSEDRRPDGFIWCKADIQGIYLTYLIVEEVSKTIKIINSRDVHCILYKALIQTIEIINSMDVSV